MSGKYRAAVGRPRELRSRRNSRGRCVVVEHITIYYTLQTRDFALCIVNPFAARGAIRKRLSLREKSVAELVTVSLLPPLFAFVHSAVAPLRL